MKVSDEIFGYTLGDVFDYRLDKNFIPDKIIYQYKESGDLFRTYCIKPLKPLFYDFDIYILVVNTSLDNKIGSIEATKELKTQKSYNKETGIIFGRVSAYLKDKCTRKGYQFTIGDSAGVLFVSKHYLNRFYRLNFNDRTKSIDFSFADYIIMKKNYKDNYGLLQAPVTERKYLMIDKGEEKVIKELEDIPDAQ